MTEYLDLEDLLAAAGAALGGTPDIRDIGLLQAVAVRPRATAFSEDAYPTLDQKAAALLHSIVTGHPLVDGNKRLGWVAVRLFYRMNEADLRVDADDAFELVVAVANGTLRDVAAIGNLLGSRRVQIEGSGPG